MAPRSSVVTLLFLLLTTVSSRALQPEGPTANECRGHIEAAIKDFLSGQQKEDTTAAIPTAEIYTRAQSNQDFVTEHDGNDDDDDVPTTLDDHQETEDEETTIEPPETDQIKYDEKREVETGDDDEDDDGDDHVEKAEEHDDDDDDDHVEKVVDGEEDDDDDHVEKVVEHDDDGDDEDDDTKKEEHDDDHDDEDDHVKTAEHLIDDDDDHEDDHVEKAAEGDDEEDHVEKVTEDDDDDDEHDHAKEVADHDDDDDDDDDKEESHAETVDHEQPEDEDDDHDDDHEVEKRNAEEDIEEGAEEHDEEEVAEEHDEEGAAEHVEEGAEEHEEGAEEHEEGAEEHEEEGVEELEESAEVEKQDEDVEVQIEAPPTVSDRFQKAEEGPEEEERGTSDTEAAEKDEEEDQEAEDRVERAAEEDGADQDEAQADDDQGDDESDKPEEQSPYSAAAPASETEDADQPEADEPAQPAEGDDEEHDDVPDEPIGEPKEEEGKEEAEEEGKGGEEEGGEKEGGEKEGGDEEGEEEEEVIVAGPGQLRTRENIETILGLGEDKIDENKEREKIGGEILKEIKRMYEGAVRPLEQLYKFKDISTRQLGDAEIFSKPMVLFLGPWSTGKSAIINYLLGTEYSRYALKTGAEPTSNSFNVIMYGDSDQVLDGTQLAADWAFSTLQKFGQSFLDRLRGRKMANPLLQKITIVDSPGILENRKSTERQYPFNDAFQWFIDRADLIYIVFDPTKLDIGMELEAIFDQLKGRESQVRILLNKADTVKPQELMKVQGTLLWNLSPLLGTSEAPTVFVGSFWSRPYLPGSPETLLDAQEEAFLEDLHDALDNRVENKVALSRRHAVRVRNHAKMVDCYLNTYYNHKSFFSNKRKVADDIVDNPQNYHIYEGLSILTNVSRYDLPDPNIYREFFSIHPLFDFKPLASTCSYFKGCPLDKLDIAIAYDLPELVGKYQRLMSNRSVVGGR